jgi:hypothetical protein
MSPHSTPLAPPPSGAFFVPEYPNRVDRYSPPWQNGHARDNNPLWLRAPARPRDSSPKPTRCSTGAWRQPSDVPERHADEPRGAIERSSPFLRSWLFRETRAYPKKTRAQSENGCALDNRPSTGEGKWAAGCFYNAPSARWFLWTARRKQKENPGTCQGGPEALPRHKEMTRPVTSTLKAVPGRATTVVSCPTEPERM